MNTPHFADRRDAGRQLAARLDSYRDRDPLILALPRGGVPVGFEVAAALDAPLDVIVVRKIGAPAEPELGIGAVVDGDQPTIVLNRDLVNELGVTRDHIARGVAREIQEIRRREECYRQGQPRPDLARRTAIVVDDGIATGGSMRAALRGARRAKPSRLVLAVPVAPPETISALGGEADDIVCLFTPRFFGAVGNFYQDFRQVPDEEVIRLLQLSRQRRPRSV